LVEVSRNTFGISLNSMDKRLRRMAVEVKVTPRFTRLYTIMPRKAKETISAVSGSRNPNYNKLPLLKLQF
jgi:hypothetical protein